MCGICDGDSARRQEIDALLDEDKLSHSEIAMQVWGSNSRANKARIQRYAAHRQTKIASAGVPGDGLDGLCVMIEKQLQSAERRKDWRAIPALLTQLTKLRKVIHDSAETQRRNTPPASPWSNEIASFLGWDATGLDRELAERLRRDLKMFQERRENNGFLTDCAQYLVDTIEGNTTGPRWDKAITEFVGGRLREEKRICLEDKRFIGDNLQLLNRRQAAAAANLGGPDDQICAVGWLQVALLWGAVEELPQEIREMVTKLVGLKAHWDLEDPRSTRTCLR